MPDKERKKPAPGTTAPETPPAGEAPPTPRAPAPEGRAGHAAPEAAQAPAAPPPIAQTAAPAAKPRQKSPAAWCRSTLLLAGLLLALAAAAVAVVDPFFHTHAPLPGLSYRLHQERYQNPGIARHFQYDTLLTGSSMVQNFKTTDFSALLGQNAVKLPFSGGSFQDMANILAVALNNNPDLKTVYLGFDINRLRYTPGQTRYPVPEYLYDQNPLNDAGYYLNKQVLAEEVAETLLRTREGSPTTTMDEYTNFAPFYTFSQHETLTGYSGQDPIDAGPADRATLMATAAQNLEGTLLPLINSRPDVQFVIFYPPYSILYWHSFTDDSELALFEYAATTLQALPNVAQHLFFADEALVTNLYNYKDYTHYRQEINAWMVECFADDSHALTAENLPEQLKRARQMVEGFDYEALYGAGNHLYSQSDPLAWLEKLKDSRYTAYIAGHSAGGWYFATQTRQALAAIGLDEAALASPTILAATTGGKAEPLETGAGALAHTAQAAAGPLDIAAGPDQPAQITLDGVPYTAGLPGLNIVVWDNTQNRVADNIALSADGRELLRR